jgi:hypothetical protein
MLGADGQLAEGATVAIVSSRVEVLRGNEKPHAPAAVGHRVAAKEPVHIIQVEVRDLLDPKRVWPSHVNGS